MRKNTNKRKNIKSNYRKKLSKKNIKGGSNNFDLLNNELNVCDVCGQKTLINIPVCEKCSAVKRNKKGKKTSGKKGNAKASTSKSILSRVGKAQLLKFYIGPGEEIGRFIYNSNSCWIDSVLFCLFSLGNIEVINTLFVNPLQITREFSDLSKRLSDKQRFDFLKLFRHRLCLAHNMIMVGGQNTEYIDNFKLRDIFKCCESLHDYATTKEGEAIRLIGSLFAIFPTRIQPSLRYYEFVEKVYDLDAPFDESIQSVSEQELRKFGFIPGEGQTEFLIKFCRRDDKVHITNEPIFQIPNYRLQETQTLSQLLFEIQTQREEFRDVLEGIPSRFKFEKRAYKIECFSNYLIFNFDRFGGSSYLRQDNIVYPDEILETLNKRLVLHCIIMRNADSALSSAHFTSYFKFGDSYYFYNDIGHSVKHIGTYQNLIEKEDALRKSVIFIYQEEGVQTKGYGVIKPNVKTHLTIHPSEAGSASGAPALPKKTKTKGKTAGSKGINPFESNIKFSKTNPFAENNTPTNKNFFTMGPLASKRHYRSNSLGQMLPSSPTKNIPYSFNLEPTLSAKSKGSPAKSTRSAKSKGSPTKSTRSAKSKGSPAKSTRSAKSKGSPAKSTRSAKSKSSPAKSGSKTKKKKSTTLQELKSNLKSRRFYPNEVVNSMNKRTLENILFGNVS